MSVQTSYNDAPAIGFAGMLADDGPHDIMAMINQDTASIAFGRGVIFKSGGNDQDVKLPLTSQADKVVGIVVHSNAYSRSWTDVNGTFGQVDSVGLRPGVMMNVLRKGRILVVCEDGCTKGDRLYVRAVSAEDGTEFYGGLNNASDSTDMIDCTGQGQWLTTTAAGQLAVLEVDFQSEP